MIVPDANLLLYAVNEDSRDHVAAFRWWTGLLAGEELVGLCEPVIFAFLRLGTSRRIMPSPLTVEEAFAYVENWLEFPLVSRLQGGASHFGTVKSLLIDAGTGGNLVTDAQIAAVALHHGATVHTVDMDFSRFSAVKWKNPLLKE